MFSTLWWHWLLMFFLFQGSKHLYSRHLRPFLLKHQARIDRLLNLLSNEIVCSPCYLPLQCINYLFSHSIQGVFACYNYFSRNAAFFLLVICKHLSSCFNCLRLYKDQIWSLIFIKHTFLVIFLWMILICRTVSFSMLDPSSIVLYWNKIMILFCF